MSLTPDPSPFGRGEKERKEEIEQGEAAPQGKHEPTGAAGGDTADEFTNVELSVGPAARVEDVQIPGMDIHPIEPGAASIPSRSFPKVGTRIQDEFGSGEFCLLHFFTCTGRF